MKKYYAGMGLGSSSSYVGSYGQNIAMIQWMKKNGFKRSGSLASMVNSVGEDGLFLGRKDDTVLAKQDWLIARDMTTQLIDFAKYMSVPNSNVGTSGNAEVNLNITLPNVKDEKTFLDAIKTNRKIQEALADVTIGRAMGKNSLNVNRHK